MSNNSIKKRKKYHNQSGSPKNKSTVENRDLLSALNHANTEIADQLLEKKKREADWSIAQQELIYQEGEKGKTGSGIGHCQ